MALSAADLAAELMPAFGPDGPRRGKELGRVQLISWLARGNPRMSGRQQLEPAVREAMQVLEHAELVRFRRIQGGGGCWNLSRLGEAALANGDFIQRIKDR